MKRRSARGAIYTSIGLSLAIVLSALTTGLNPAAVSAATPPKPTITSVQVASNQQTIRIGWSKVDGVQGDFGYEFYWRDHPTADNRTPQWRWFDWVQHKDGLSSIALSPKGSWNPQPDGRYQISMRVKHYETQSLSPLAKPARVNMASAVLGIRQVEATDTSVTVAWDRYRTWPFVSYDFFLGREGDAIWKCYVGSSTSRSMTQRTLSDLPSRCGGRSLQPGETYHFGVRVTQREANTAPLVRGSVSKTTVQTEGGTSELLQTAQVNGKWEIVDSSGQPVELNGVSIRRGRGRPTFFDGDPADIQAIKDKGFNTVRIVMEWDRFQPNETGFHAQSFGALDELVQVAADAGLYIILDPLHTVGSQYVPQWAWDKSNNGNRDSEETIQTVEANAMPYLRYVLDRYRNEPQIAAIDLVNEPAGLPGDHSLRRDHAALMEIYRNMITVAREIEPDMPIILQPFGGNAKITSTELRLIGDDFTNLIWSLHDYYSGNAGGPDHDGYNPSGYLPWRTAPSSADGMLVLNTWNTSSCYPAGEDSESCPSNWARRRDVLRPSMASHVRVNATAAQESGMPLLIGEYGLPHRGRRWETTEMKGKGWGGGHWYTHDKKDVYDGLGVSRIYWAWSEAADETYGLYNPDTNIWHPWTDELVD